MCICEVIFYQNGSEHDFPFHGCLFSLIFRRQLLNSFLYHYKIEWYAGDKRNLDHSELEENLQNIKDEWPQFPVPPQNFMVCWSKGKHRSFKILRKFAYNILDEWPQFPVPPQNFMVCWSKGKHRSFKILRKFAYNILDEWPQFPVPLPTTNTNGMLVEKKNLDH